MKLQILVPTYEEEFYEVKPLLDSLAIQQNIDFDELGVIIVNDGGKSLAKEIIEYGPTVPYDIQYYDEEHRGVSGTRNSCLDHSTADYVMFCDADDMFLTVCGLYIIFREIDIGFDSLTSAFVEETRHPETKEVLYINHEMDSTFVHGKVHRRKYLISNNIRWNDALTIHEDSYFNCLCQKLTQNLKYSPTPFYLWRWRDNSVCRHDPLYLNKTYVNMLESNTALVNQFLDRGRKDDAKFYATSMIYDVYYSLNCDRWWEGEGHDYLEKTERRFAQYWKEFKSLTESIDSQIKTQIIMGIKNRFFGEGLLLERITFNDWIKHIENDFE